MTHGMLTNSIFKFYQVKASSYTGGVYFRVFLLLGAIQVLHNAFLPQIWHPPTPL